MKKTEERKILVSIKNNTADFTLTWALTPSQIEFFECLQEGGFINPHWHIESLAASKTTQ